MEEHYPIPAHYPGSYWEPAEVTVTCGCGASIYEWQAGAGGTTPGGWGDAFQDHIDDIEGDNR